MRHLSSPCAVASASGRLRERAEPSEQGPGANHMASSERKTVTPVTVRTTGAANGTEQPETVQRIRVAGARSKYRPHSLGASPHARSGRALDQCVRVWQYPRLPGARATRNFTVLQATCRPPALIRSLRPRCPLPAAPGTAIIPNSGRIGDRGRRWKGIIGTQRGPGTESKSDAACNGPLQARASSFFAKADAGQATPQYASIMI